MSEWPGRCKPATVPGKCFAALRRLCLRRLRSLFGIVLRVPAKCSISAGLCEHHLELCYLPVNLHQSLGHCTGTRFCESRLSKTEALRLAVLSGRRSAMAGRHVTIPWSDPWSLLPRRGAYLCATSFIVRARRGGFLAALAQDQRVQPVLLRLSEGDEDTVFRREAGLAGGDQDRSSITRIQNQNLVSASACLHMM